MSKIADGSYSAVVMSVQAAVQFTMPPNALRERSFSIKTGDDIDVDDICKRLVKAGYSRFE